MKEKVLGLLTSKLDKTLVEKLIKRYDETQGNYLKGDWEGTLDKAGKFVEVTMKCLHFWRTGNVQERINVGDEITELGNLPSSNPRTIRILIPRACRIVYDLASNRGGRHDRTGFESNKMDATLAASGTSWVMAEFIRFFHPTGANPNEAQEMAEDLTTLKLPIIEEISGKTFVTLPKASASSILLAILHLKGGKLPKNELFDVIERHEFSRENARVALSALKKKKDIVYIDNKTDIVHLRRQGLLKAKAILEEATNLIP